MPYTAPEPRKAMDAQLPPGIVFAEGVGDLTYLLVQVAVQYIEDRGLKYQAIAEVEGAMAQAARDFYRRVVVPYEDAKRRANGDVYPPLMLQGPQPEKRIIHHG